MPPQSDSTIDLRPDPRGVIVPVRAQAAARRNAILGVREGMLRVAVTAAPEKGKANRAVLELLSKSLGLPKSSIQLLTGDCSAKKTFLIEGVAIHELQAALAKFTHDVPD